MKFFNWKYQWIWVAILIGAFLYYGNPVLGCVNSLDEMTIEEFCANENHPCEEGLNQFKPMDFCKVELNTLIFSLTLFSLIYNIIYIFIYLVIREREKAFENS